MLRRRGVGVDDLLVADLVRVLVVVQVVVRHERRRVVDAADLAFLADLDLGRHRVDRRRRVVDVADRARRRHGLQVLVVDAVLHDRGLQGTPVVLGRDAHPGVGEQAGDPLGGRLPLGVGVLVEVLPARVRRVLEAAERPATLDRQAVRRRDRVVRHRVEVDVREVDALVGPVVDPLARQVAVQVHLAETDRVPRLVGPLDRRHRLDAGLVGDRGQRADRRVDRAGEVRRVHRLGDVQRPEVAGDVAADVVVGQVLVERRRRRDLQDLGAQVGVRDPALDRVGPVHGVLEHDVRVAGLELQLGDRLEELARGDRGLRDPVVGHELVVLLRDGDVGERLAVDALDVVRAEQVHVLVLLRQLERDVRDDDAERERLDADLLVRVLTLGVEEPHDVGVVRVQVHRTRALTRAELVRVGEGVLEQLHHGDDAGRLVLDVLDRRAVLADVAEQQGDAAAALGQLQRGVDAPRDRLHVVLDAQQEAGHGLAALRLADVEERGGRRLEPAGDDLRDDVAGDLLVAVGQAEGHHGDPVLEALEVLLPVERLERVRRVVLERAEEGVEAEVRRVRGLEELLDEGARVLGQHGRVVVLVLDQVVQLLVERGEVDRVRLDVLPEVLARRLAVLLELDLAVRSVEVEHRVERVVVELHGLQRHLGGPGGRGRVRRAHAEISDCRCQNRPNPSRTRRASSAVPRSSKAYRYGTWHFAEMMSPAMQ